MMFSYWVCFFHFYHLPEFCGPLRLRAMLDTSTHSLKINPYSIAEWTRNPIFQRLVHGPEETVNIQESGK